MQSSAIGSPAYWTLVGGAELLQLVREGIAVYWTTGPRATFAEPSVIILQDPD